MSTKIVTFRCPVDILDQVDSTAGFYKRSRNSVLLAAVRLFSRQLRERQSGMMSPPLPAEMLTRESLFPRPESRGGRPPKNKPQA